MSNKSISQVGHYTTWSGTLTSAVVGNIPGYDFFDDLPDGNIKDHCQEISQQTKEDLNKLAKVYEKYNVNVFRPKIINQKPCIKMCNNIRVLNPRPNISPFDHIFCRDNKIILTWQDIERFEDEASVQHIIDQMSHEIKIVSIRPPSDYDINFYNKLSLEDWPGNKDMLLDSPSFSPAGKHIFYSSKYLCTPKGIEFMKQEFPDAKFIALNHPITNHLDAQFRIIKLGHVITCHDPQKLIQQVPYFSNWEIYQDTTWKQQQKNKTKNTPMSAWTDEDENDSSVHIGFVHINSDLVVIQRENKSLCNALEKAKVDWIHCPIKYDQYFGLAVSCATAILHRTDECIDYFV